MLTSTLLEKRKLKYDPSDYWMIMTLKHMLQVYEKKTRFE